MYIIYIIILYKFKSIFTHTDILQVLASSKSNVPMK